MFKMKSDVITRTKNIVFLVVAMLLIALGVFAGIGIRTKANIVEKPQVLVLTEKSS